MRSLQSRNRMSASLSIYERIPGHPLLFSFFLRSSSAPSLPSAFVYLCRFTLHKGGGRFLTLLAFAFALAAAAAAKAPTNTFPSEE